MHIYHRIRIGLTTLVLLGLLAFDAHAVPSFARQTGLDCSTCHLSWLELSPTGRQFKLAGYTWGERQLLPVAGMLQFSRTASRKTDVSEPESFERDRQAVLQEASLFVAGKITDHVGAFTQLTYDGLEHHSAIDNVDVRYANQFGDERKPIIYGISLNNNPTVQDIYNTGPAWGFPFASPDVGVKPNAATAIESLGQQVAGVGAYTLWRNLVYAELSAYRTADQAASVLRAGTDRESAARLRSYNPYWRFALQHEWNGTHSAMIGTYGMAVDRYPSNLAPIGPTDRFRDIAFDAQYQYIGNTDHRASAQLNYIREKQYWNGTTRSNPTDTLSALRAKATFYYQARYGVNVGYFSTWGTPDASLYDTGSAVTGSSRGSPDSSGYIAEFNYLPQRDIRLVVQYTGYTKFNGARTNYDALGRNAKDNNTLFLLGWFMF